MAKIERTKNTITGSIWGLIEKLSNILLPFIIRTLLIKKLGAEYLGLSSLFSSILQVLNLTELGFGSAVVFAMYKPIAEDNYDMVGAILSYLRKIYRVIGVVIILIGLGIIPFLDFFISGDVPENINITILYLIYLFNTAVSYILFAHKTSLLLALQCNDVIGEVGFFTNTAMYIIQIIILMSIPNYYVYIAVIPLTTIVANIIRSLIVDRRYKRWLIYGNLDSQVKQQIRSKVWPLMGTKLAVVVINSSDTLVISSFLGLSSVAMYNNYFYIMNSVLGCLMVVYNAMQSGIGNSLVMDSLDKILSDYNKFSFVNNWIITLCSTCLLCLYQPFMKIWVGEGMMLSTTFVALMTLYFYMSAIGKIIVIYKDAAGIWREDMIRCYFTNFLNLAVNIVTVKKFGVYGVIGSSILAVLIAVPWTEKILFKIVFKTGTFKANMTMIRNGMVAIFISCLAYFFTVNLPDGILWLTVRLLMCVIICNSLLFLLFRSTRDYKEMVTWIKSTMRRMDRRNMR